MADSSTQLALYNSALLLCRSRALASLSENREPRFLLDTAWADGIVDACLEDGQWFFAMRSVQIDYDPSVQPSWGYRYAFDKPSDWILTSAVCEEEYFRVPLTRYFDEAGFWYADLQTIYVRFVSNDPNYGASIGKWPRSFYDLVTARLAKKVVRKISEDEDTVKDIDKAVKEAKREAKNRNAMADPTQFPAQGSWTRSRQRFLNRRDGGNTSGNLIG
jgi:hypothetical protein